MSNARASAALRLRVGFLVIAIVLSVLGARLVQLQAIDPKSYAVMAATEGTVTVTLPASRGTISDRNGLALAHSVDGLMVVADPTLTDEDAPELATFLSQRLDVDYFGTLQRLRRTDSRFQYIARRVPAAIARDVVAEARELGYAGLSTRDDPVRDYPTGDVAANLLGFMGADGDPLAGLELTFDRTLSGTDGSARYQVGFGNRIPLGESTVVPARHGDDLQLTIDGDLQWFVQRVLRSTVEGARAESGVAIVMDTRTGEILALADHPTFDARAPLEAPKADLGSRAMQDVYEPGSVEKVLTMAALLDAGKVTPQTQIEVPPNIRRSGRTIRDHWQHGDIRLTLAGVLSKSSNVGTILAASELTREELHDYLVRFGLGARTDVGVRGETRGLLPDVANWSQLSHDTIAFGQGLSVNALQMIAAVNAVANDGVRVDPSLVRGVATTDTGTEVGTDTATSTRVISSQAARDTAEMMELVVDPEAGVAPRAQVPGYRVAGKTGTAQRVGADCGCYDGTFTVSFAGFAPADDPRFTVYVVVQNPGTRGGGGSITGPAFAKIMGHLLHRYAVPPTGTPGTDLAHEW
ncbi:peptidoglycan D,D-transpeptidase FtsI family protein [Nocardioides limicola]|uniref:peptidoglycan D,D-transpeptidase FtsI family protein n=1 Tax=Nocardioides limicola TaxID=2803368 RepID=UPI0027DC1908|nr:penicillin-binding protein 2 [Nocardioides sp. DJM-14]